MSGYTIDLLYGAMTALLGAAAAWGLCCLYFRHNDNRQGNAKSRHATEVLIRLRDLATRVAIDVEEHSNQVERINGKLTATDGSQPQSIVDAVTKLMEANQQIQERLTSTEDKLRQQAQQIEINALEARTDPLTLLANRRAMDDEMDRRLAELRRHGRTFSLIMADLDRFKGVNDAYGHPVGDQVLREVATALRRTMRDMDMVARYGGEEFAIILPGTAVADACKAAAARPQGRRDRPLPSPWRGPADHREPGRGRGLRRGERRGPHPPRGQGPLWRQGRRTQRRLLARRPGHLAGRHGDACAAPRPMPRPPAEPAQAMAAKIETALRWTPAALAESLALTDLPTRTIFCQQVRNRMAEWKRGGPTFSILLVEINQSAKTASRGRRRARRFPGHRRQVSHRQRPRDGRAGPLRPRMLRLAAADGPLGPGHSDCPAIARGVRRGPWPRPRRAIAAHAQLRHRAGHGQRRHHFAAEAGGSGLGRRRPPRRRRGLLRRRQPLPADQLDAGDPGLPLLTRLVPSPSGRGSG